MPSTFVVRLWLPDRPGALGAVASRIGAVRGDVVGIEILERGAGRAIDELVVELPDPALVGLLAAEIGKVDEVDVEDIRPLADTLHDPRLDALETAARLVGADGSDGLLEALPVHAARMVGAAWSAVVDLEGDVVVTTTGETPPAAWLLAFVAGSRSSGSRGCDDVIWAPLPAAALGLVLGRQGSPFRAKERRQAAALARIADARWRALRTRETRFGHPSAGGAVGSSGYSVAQFRARSTARSHWE